MENLTTHLLFNLSLLIVLLFLCFMLPKRFLTFQYYKKTALLYCIAAIIVCILFSYRLTSSMIMDLCMVPFMIGAFYLRQGPLLALIIVIFSPRYGSEFAFYYLLGFYGCISILIWFISPWFLKLPTNKRILFSTGITLLLSMINLIVVVVLFPHFRSLDIIIAFIIVAPIGVAMFSFIIEMIEKNQQLSQQLLKNEKLEAVEQMGAAISHEIRNPLTSAIGFAQLLGEESLEAGKRMQYLSIIKGELEAAEQVIKDYLTFSKPQIDASEVLNVNNELFHIIKLMEPLANSYSIKISCSFSSIGYIEGDRQKFHQCLINIFRNVIDSLPNGGDILIETEKSKKNINIYIKDSGFGMSETNLERLGEPHYVTNGKKGTGLGIMVAYSIVRAMKGTIDVKSEMGKGTTYRFSFKRMV